MDRVRVAYCWSSKITSSEFTPLGRGTTGPGVEETEQGMNVGGGGTVDAGLATVWDAVFLGTAVVGTAVSGCGCGGRVCLFSFTARSFAVEMSLRIAVEREERSEERRVGRAG